jgi:hypothetical protein
MYSYNLRVSHVRICIAPGADHAVPDGMAATRAPAHSAMVWGQREDHPGTV